MVLHTMHPMLLVPMMFVALVDWWWLLSSLAVQMAPYCSCVDLRVHEMLIVLGVHVRCVACLKCPAIGWWFYPITLRGILYHKYRGRRLCDSWMFVLPAPLRWLCGCEVLPATVWCLGFPGTFWLPLLPHYRLYCKQVWILVLTGTWCFPWSIQLLFLPLHFL